MCTLTQTPQYGQHPDTVRFVGLLIIQFIELSSLLCHLHGKPLDVRKNHCF